MGIREEIFEHTGGDKFSPARKFIFSRMPVNFLPYINLFSPAKKFISSRMKIYFFPQRNFLPPARKFIPCRNKAYFVEQYGSFQRVKWLILACEMAEIAGQNG